MKKLLSLYLIISAFVSFAQNRQTDSLFAALPKAKEDTVKVNMLIALVNEFRYTNLDTAMHFVTQALALANKLDYQRGIADSKLMIGALNASLGKNEEGIKAATESIVIYEKLLKTATAGNRKQVLAKLGRAYNVIGHNRTSQGNYPEALKNYFIALPIREEAGDKKGVFDTEFSIGNIYLLELDYSEALRHYYIAKKVCDELKSKTDLSLVYGAISYVQISQANYTEALKNSLASLQHAEESKDDNAISEAYNVMGIIYDKLGNYSEALKYDFAALETNLKIGNNEQLPAIYNSIGLVYMKQKKFKQAAEYLDKALSFSKHIGKLEYITLSYESWAVFDSVMGNYKKSLESYKLFILHRDSLRNSENTRKITQQQMQYDFDKKEVEVKAEQDKKDALTQKELQKQKLVRNGFVGGFAIVLSFAGIFFSQRNKIKKGKERSDELLLNILPSEVAEELKEKGSADAKQFDDVTVMFTDFKNFTSISEKLSPTELVNEIHTCFKAFDNIIGKHNIEKIKTIGDAYMCAGGLPVANTTNATDVVNAGIEIQQFMEQHLQHRRKEGKDIFEIRIGIHTGPVVAGIVGVKKFAYDIWGDTVNIASRMESSGEAGKVNISGSTYELVKDKFKCVHRGKIQAKNKGEIDMYFVERPRALKL